jgi:hypothetical protein
LGREEGELVGSGFGLGGQLEHLFGDSHVGQDNRGRGSGK